MMKIEVLARAYSSTSGIDACYFDFYSNFIVKGGSLLPIEGGIISITGYIKVDSIHGLHCFKLAKSFCNVKILLLRAFSAACIISWCTTYLCQASELRTASRICQLGLLETQQQAKGTNTICGIACYLFSLPHVCRLLYAHL